MRRRSDYERGSGKPFRRIPERVNWAAATSYEIGLTDATDDKPEAVVLSLVPEGDTSLRVAARLNKGQLDELIHWLIDARNTRWPGP